MLILEIFKILFDGGYANMQAVVLLLISMVLLEEVNSRTLSPNLLIKTLANWVHQQLIVLMRLCKCFLWRRCFKSTDAWPGRLFFHHFLSLYPTENPVFCPWTVTETNRSFNARIESLFVRYVIKFLLCCITWLITFSLQKPDFDAT